MTGDATAHPTATVLERFSVGDLPPALRDQVARHIAGCADCGQVVQGLAAERDARLATVSPERFVAEVASRRDRDASLLAIRRRRWRGAGLATATAAVVAAAAAVFVLMPRPAPPISLKGAGIAVYRSRAQRVQAIASADAIRAGDALRVVVTLPRPAQVAAWSVDARGRVDSLLPGGALSLPAGEQALPDSAIVENP